MRHIDGGPFSEQLRHFRIRAGLSQAALAERANLSTAAVATLERGVRSAPYPRTLDTLAEALGLSSAERVAFAAAARSAQPRRPPARAHAGARPPSAEDPSRPAPQLPVWLTSFVGREVEVAAVRTLLDPAGSAVRLLTLLGLGGVGKTRLAVAAAERLTVAYPDGVVFVDLAPLHDARLVPATIARVLGVRESGGRSARELVLEHLHGRHLLLLLDNFEHLLPAAPLVPELLQRCPHVAVLVTSRTALRVQGERRFAVAPLATPSAEADTAELAVSASPAVRLFVERAQAVAADVGLDAQTAPAIAEICRRLDGMPLAIELAAARAGLLRPPALLRRLERRLPLLTGGAADLPERQQTLRTTLAWSHELLGPGEQAVFRRLAVFAGGWTLEAAEAVCADAELPAEAVLDHLEVLVDSSLVRRLDAAGGEPRFGMLETVREYAEEQLVGSNEAEASRARHRDWCLRLVADAAPRWQDSQQVADLDRERDNLRAALRWTLDTRDVEAALRLAIGCWPLWYVRGRYAEGRAWLADVLGLATPPDQAALRSRALAHAGHLAYCEGDADAAERLLREALATAEAAGDPHSIGIAAQFLGNVSKLRGKLTEAERQYERALALARRGGNRTLEILAVGSIAMLRLEGDDAAGARPCR
jgi:predicted ATPase/transcriptional regulator with XRE-family HTH domain